MKRMVLFSLVLCLLIAGCASRQMAQEVIINMTLGSTTEEEIISRLGTPKDLKTQFITGDKIERILHYGTWRSEGKYYRLIIHTERGKTLEAIASPDNHSKYTQISFRFVDGKLTHVYPGHWGW